MLQPIIKELPYAINIPSELGSDKTDFKGHTVAHQRSKAALQGIKQQECCRGEQSASAKSVLSTGTRLDINALIGSIASIRLKSEETIPLKSEHMVYIEGTGALCYKTGHNAPLQSIAYIDRRSLVPSQHSLAEKQWYSEQLRQKSIPEFLKSVDALKPSSKKRSSSGLTLKLTVGKAPSKVINVAKLSSRVVAIYHKGGQDVSQLILNTLEKGRNTTVEMQSERRMRESSTPLDVASIERQQKKIHNLKKQIKSYQKAIEVTLADAQKLGRAPSSFALGLKRKQLDKLLQQRQEAIRTFRSSLEQLDGAHE